MDANRNANAYTWVYYGVRVLCLLVCVLAACGTAFFAVGPLWHSFSGHPDLAATELTALSFVFPALFLAAAVYALVQLLRKFREMTARSTWVMSLVLAAMAWEYFSARFDDSLPFPPSGVGPSEVDETVRIILPLMGAWGVYTVMRPVLAVIANRSQRQTQEVTQQG